jgi:hypothetical protein
METDNHEIKDKIIITTSGLINSQKIKKENNEDESIYFGSKEPNEEPVTSIFLIIYDYIFYYRMEILIIIYQFLC